MSVRQFKIKFSRIPQKIPLPWADDPAAKRLLKRNEWLTGDNARLPRHYVEFYKKWEIGPQAFVHQIQRKERFEKDEFGNVRRVQDARIPVLYPDEFHQGLWGGEGVVKGGLEPEPTKHQPQFKPAKETYWMPKLHLGVVHSEILDKHIEVLMTERASRLIDEAFGLDNYLLKTKVNELYSHFGLKLKRELLLTLANPEEELCVNDAAKRNEMLDKYADFVLPHEEADWHGLSLTEALHKQHTLDRLEEEQSVKPKKEEYREKMLHYIETGDHHELAAVYDQLYEPDTSYTSQVTGFIKDKFTPKK